MLRLCVVAGLVPRPALRLVVVSPFQGWARLILMTQGGAQAADSRLRSALGW